MKRKIWLSLFVVCWFNCVGQKKISDVSNYEGGVKKITVNSEEIAYVEEGAGEKTLLFIHGLSSNLEAWKNNIAGLKQDYKCVALDLPGYGKSSKRSSSYSLAEYAAFINDFILKKNLENVILTGHSMGGQIAVTAVYNYPALFKKLILIAPAGIETFTVEEAGIMKSSYTPETIINSTPEQIRNNYRMNFFSFPKDAEFMVEDRLAMRHAEDFPAYAQVIVSNISAMLDAPVIDRLAEIKIPVLIIYGINDMLIPNKHFHPEQTIGSLVKDAEERIEDLQVELIEDAGHFVNFEKAGEVNLMIKNFVTHR